MSGLEDIEEPGKYMHEVVRVTYMGHRTMFVHAYCKKNYQRSQDCRFAHFIDNFLWFFKSQIP